MLDRDSLPMTPKCARHVGGTFLACVGTAPELKVRPGPSIPAPLNLRTPGELTTINIQGHSVQPAAGGERGGVQVDDPTRLNCGVCPRFPQHILLAQHSTDHGPRCCADARRRDRRNTGLRSEIQPRRSRTDGSRDVRHQGKPLAIVINGVFVAAPFICMLAAGFTRAEADCIA